MVERELAGRGSLRGGGVKGGGEFEGFKGERKLEEFKGSGS